MKKIILSIMLAMVLASLMYSVYAFGVSAPYWNDNPLIMYSGETKTINLNLQNMVGNESVTVKAEIKKGAEFVKLEKDTYTVPAGTADTYVPLKITVPKDTKDSFRVEVDFKTVTPGAGGVVAMGTGMVVSFDVLISGEKPKSEGVSKAWIAALIILIVIIAIIIISLILKRSKKKR